MASLSSTPLPSPPPLSLFTIISESRRIIKSHSRHFLALSVLFLLPLSFSIIVYPTLQQLIRDTTQNHSSLTLLRDYHQKPTSQNPLPLAYTLFVYLFSISAIGSITYSVFHGFYGRPVKLLAAIKSLFTSFLPLLATTLVSQAIVSGIALIFGMVIFSIVKLVNSFGVEFKYTSPSFMALVLVCSVALVLVLAYIQVEWALVYVIVVVESSWGFKALQRSSNLIKGYKRLALYLYLYYSLLIGILVLGNARMSMHLGSSVSDGWRSWSFVLQIVLLSSVLTLVFLQYMAANTVLYMYCKAIHGELASEIAEEFAKEYVSLPFDDGKVPHLVSVAHLP